MHMHITHNTQHATHMHNPYKVAYTACIAACSNVGLWARALALLDRIESSGLRPTVITMNTAIGGCGGSASPIPPIRWRRALRLLFEARARVCP